MVELRKRPAPKEPAAPAPAAKRSASKPRTTAGTAASKVKKVAQKAKAAVAGESSTTDTNAGIDEVPPSTGETSDPVEAGVTASGDGVPATTTTAAHEEVKKPEEPTTSVAPTSAETSSSTTKPTPLSETAISHPISPSTLSLQILTNNAQATTLSSLLSSSNKGIVIFTYPKASTPGCTTQACLFRDSYKPLKDEAGLSVFGLSSDSPKANDNFVKKQGLPFELLCDTEAVLTGALGLKKGVGKGTLRGVVVISKEGIVEVWFQGGPAKTLEVVMEWIGKQK